MLATARNLLLAGLVLTGCDTPDRRISLTSPEGSAASSQAVSVATSESAVQTGSAAAHGSPSAAQSAQCVPTNALCVSSNPSNGVVPTGKPADTQTPNAPDDVDASTPPATASPSVTLPVSNSTATSASGLPSVSPSSVPKVPTCDAELLDDGGFEKTPSPWTEYSNFTGIHLLVGDDAARLKARNVTPHSGNGLAWLGGTPDNTFNSYETSLRQTFGLPDGLSTLTLSGYLWLDTQELDPSATYDVLYLELAANDEDETLEWQANAWTPLDAESGWMPFSFTYDEANRLSGRTIRIRLTAYTDTGGITDFWLDDLSLVASCGH